MKKYRFIVLGLIIAAILITTLAVVVKNGSHYTLCYTNTRFGEWLYTENTEPEVVLENENVVKIEKIYFDSQYRLCLDLTALNKGETTIKARVGQHPLEDTAVKVTAFDFIYEEFILNFNGYHTVEYIILLCLGLISAAMIYSFFESKKKGEFSYSMVVYGSAGLFSAAIVVYALYYMRTFDNFRFALYTISETGYYFVIVAAPLMFILSGLCAFSNIWLVRHEGFRTANLLGIILGVLIFAGTMFVTFGRFGVHRYLDSRTTDALVVSASYLISFMECIFLFIMLTAFFSTRHYPAFNKDYVIILGCGIRKDGTLTPLLKARVDAAVSFEARQYDKTGKHAKFVPSGGQGPNEVISESLAMTNYLKEIGIPEDRIIMEDKSINTWQNIKYSRDKIWEDAGDKKVKTAFATTNYHIFRGYVLAQEHGLDTEGISAKTKWYFFPNAFLREFAGLLATRKIPLLITAAVIFMCSAAVHLALV